jgi:hypothetical protein
MRALTSLLRESKVCALTHSCNGSVLAAVVAVVSVTGSAQEAGMELCVPSGTGITNAQPSCLRWYRLSTVTI